MISINGWVYLWIYSINHPQLKPTNSNKHVHTRSSLLVSQNPSHTSHISHRSSPRSLFDSISSNSSQLTLKFSFFFNLVITNSVEWPEKNDKIPECMPQKFSILIIQIHCAYNDIFLSPYSSAKFPIFFLYLLK